MKKLLIALVFGLLTLVPCYAQQGVRSQKFTVVGTSTPINLINTAIAYHLITFNVVGTASACTVALDTSMNGSTWSSGGAISGQDCTSNGSSTIVNVVANYVRIDMTALTVTAGSSVSVTWDGWITSPGGGGAVVDCTTSGGVLYQNGTDNTATCGPDLTWDSSANNLLTFGLYVGDPQFYSPPLPAQAQFVGDDEGVASSTPTGLQAVGVASGAGSSGQGINTTAQSQGSNDIQELNAFAATADHGSSGTLIDLVGLELENDTEDGAGAVTNSESLLIDTPAFASITAVPLQEGIDIQDQGVSIDGTSPTDSIAVHIESQTNKAIVVEGGESDFAITSMTKCIAGCVLVAALTTTAATSDNVTVTGMTSSGHCSLTPTNATAIALATLPYVSAKTTNQITVTHAVTSGATFDILCTSY